MHLTTWIAFCTFVSTFCSAQEMPIPPSGAKLAFHENWQTGVIEPSRWYLLRKQWGKGNHGVVPENVSIVKERVDGVERLVLQCVAQGDEYDGSISGLWKKKTRVGGVIVSKQHFASGLFEVKTKIGTPQNPTPSGIVPAIWTYGYRVVKVEESLADSFQKTKPLYHPYLQNWGKGLCFYWSELDFPEYGKDGKFARPMFNTFLNKQHEALTYDVHGAADGNWHTYTRDLMGTQRIPASHSESSSFPEGS